MEASGLHLSCEHPSHERRSGVVEVPNLPGMRPNRHVPRGKTGSFEMSDIGPVVLSEEDKCAAPRRRPAHAHARLTVARSAPRAPPA